MAGFPGGRKPLGMAGIPPGAPPPFVTATANPGLDNYYLMGLALAEDINPVGSANTPQKATFNATIGTDTFYTFGFVLAESSTIGPNAGSFRMTAQGSVGADTFYIFGLVLAER